MLVRQEILNKKVKSNWICFLDSDDARHDKIRKQVEFIKENLNCNILHTNEVWYKNGKYLKQLNKHKKEGYIFENCLKLCCIRQVV